MRIADYPYGKVTKTLRKATKWLNVNRLRLIKEVRKEPRRFDYPYYWGMPKSITSRMSVDEHDWLVGETWRWFSDL